jgi:hypothetical protein
MASQFPGFPKGTWDVEDRLTKQKYSSKAYIPLITKRPCKRCNNEWMQRLETRARPLLIHLMNNSPTVLSYDDQVTIGTWFFKTATTYDLHAEKKRNCYFESQELQNLAECLYVNPTYSFYLGAYYGRQPAMIQEDHLTVSFVPFNDRAQPSNALLVRAYSLTLAIKHLVLQIFCVKNPVDFDTVSFYMPDYSSACIQLGVEKDPAQWPPQYYFNDEGLEAFTYRWQKLGVPPT